MVAFIVLCVLVVAAASVLVYVLVTRDSRSGSSAITTPAASQSGEPSSTAPAPPPPAPPPAGTFTTFVVPTAEQCPGRGNRHATVAAQVTWATSNATQVWIAQGTGDAVQAAQEQVPLAGNQDSFPTPVLLDCNQSSVTLTMTLIGADGNHVSRSWTVQLMGRHGGP
jgi:hypothetical protein